MKTISIKDIEGIRIGNAQNFTGGTGCTVILSETGTLKAISCRSIHSCSSSWRWKCFWTGCCWRRYAVS